MVCSIFSIFSLFLSAKLYISICDKRKMTLFSITSFHVDLNEVAKCVNIDMALTLLASLSRSRTFVENKKWRRHLPYL